MTEKEAKTKWCPFVRFAGRTGDEGTFNRGDVDPMNLADKGDEFVPRCIASACMAWLWIREPDSIQERQQNAEGTGFEMVPRIIEGDGSCGLAGAPR